MFFCNSTGDRGCGGENVLCTVLYRDGNAGMKNCLKTGLYTCLNRKHNRNKEKTSSTIMCQYKII